MAGFGSVHAFINCTAVNTVHQNLTGNVSHSLNSCIKIRSANITPRVAIPWQVCFCLDAEIIQEIEQIRASKTRLVLSPTNLANLRHYALLNLPVDRAKRPSPKQQWAASHRLLLRRKTTDTCGQALCAVTVGQSSLTFSTQYSSGEQNPTTLLRSVIDLRGEVSQQVQQQLVNEPALLDSLSQAHYWLIGEIMTQLPLKSAAWYSWSVPVFWTISTVVISILLGYFIPGSYFLKAIVCISILSLSKAIYQIVIAKKLKYWVIHQLVDGFLAQDIMKRQFGLKLLSLLI
ncbi:MAG: hypothetical protein AAFQ14_13430 [Cyanobacteria bacterium J06621_12]